MANKYIIHGAAYCGDGTASNEAASAGAAGAWNDINVLEGTAPAYGTAPAAGDVVYIRSKTSAGADITRTMTAIVNIGSASATAASPITWVIDGGTVWSGISGVLKYTHAYSAGYTVSLRTENRVIAEVPDSFVIENTSASPNQARQLTLNNGYIKNLLVDASLGIGSIGIGGIVSSSGTGTLENLHFKVGKLAAAAFSHSNSSISLNLINPNIELFGTPNSSYPLFYPASSGCINVFGGNVSGVGATTNQYLVHNGFNGNTNLFGLQYPNEIGICVPTTGATIPGKTSIYGANKGASGAWASREGVVDSRYDNNYPVLSAVLPDGNSTGWSFSIYPFGASYSQPVVVQLAKTNTYGDALADITVEFLVADSFAGLNTENVWIVGQYINTSGDPVGFSTKATFGQSSALVESTAAWSATTYGAITFFKRKITYSLPSAVKNGTEICVQFMLSARSASANDIVGVCPDFTVVYA